MTGPRLARFATALEALARKNQTRRLQPRDGHDFASNDYLGLAGSSRLAAAVADALDRGVPVGGGGSRLLRGNHPEHEALEAEAAAFFGAERALYFGSGYAANVALFSTLPQRGDLIVHDALIHASAREGMRATKAEIAEAAHNDVGAVADAIAGWRARGAKGTPWIGAESLYSMDGDCAPVDDLLALAERHDGVLLLDEAHATGVFGRGGRGLGEAHEGHDALVSLHTCGKALGASGALVTAKSGLIDFLINRAKPFIYATAPSPLIAAAVREALRIVDEEPDRRARLASLVALAGDRLRRFGFPRTPTQIQPVILGANARAAAVAARVQAAGYDCRAIRPPTVPEGTARLRISLTLNVDADAVTGLIDTVAGALTDAVA